jgi:hypothetical protein
MTTVRKEIVDPTLTRLYHCISKCVHGGFLLGQGFENRKQWIEDRLQVLCMSFVCYFKSCACPLFAVCLPVLNHGETIRIESLLGTTMDVSVVRETTFGPHAAIIPRVSGRAYSTGRNEFWINPADPLAHGFLLR